MKWFEFNIYIFGSTLIKIIENGMAANSTFNINK